MAGRRLSEAMYQEAIRLDSAGVPGIVVAAKIGCAKSMISNIRRLYPRGPGNRRKSQLSLEEREEISRGIGEGKSRRSIARRLNRAPSTISREVAAQGAFEYRAWRGERRAYALASRPKPRKLEANAALAALVQEGLEKEWSPEQIAKRLRKETPDNPQMQVSHETIYKALYIQGRGTLRKELKRHLRQRKPRRQKPREKLSRIPDMVNISERPAEANDRAVPGHWEGDLIIGKGGKSSIGTLVERTTRFVMLLHLPEGRTAEHLRQALTKAIQRLPVALRRSLTWDQGRELAKHAQFTVDTGVQVYFCDPHSPWQRGSNENTNGLLRQYFAKGEDLSKYDAEYLERIADKLNGRPRQTLDWSTPSEALNELLR